jgi:hypothetical protein
MSEFGYIPEAPKQSFENNKGIFTPKDIYDLTRANKWTSYGQLELIETQTITSSTPYLDFINLANTNYNVHFLTLNNMQPATHNESVGLQLSKNNGSSFIASGYQYAGQYNDSDGSNGEGRSTSNTAYPPIYNVSNTATGASANGYFYFYNLLDSTKYSFITNQGVNLTNVGNLRMIFSNGVYAATETHNAIRFKFFNGNITDLEASLYGIRYS